MFSLLLALALSNTPPAKPYWMVTFDKVLSHTKVCAVGTVVYRRRMKDGDWHITLVNNKGDKLVTEIIPELPIVPPKKGQKILACGVSRRDYKHGWNEIHPVVRWQEAK
jgi:hypothetical protein